MTQSPDKTWSLETWFNAVRINNIQQQVIEFVNDDEQVNLPHHDGIVWTRQVYNWKTLGIAERDDARLMVTVLNHYSKQNQRTIMRCPDLRTHAEIFFESAACKPRNNWLPLTDAEIRAICPSSCAEDELLRHVHPYPQNELFGRDRDFNRIGNMIGEQLVTPIVSEAGDGKTAFAWHSATLMKSQQGFRCFDWVTDKTSYISPITGEEESIPNAEATRLKGRYKSRITDSAIGRFIKVDADWEVALDTQDSEQRHAITQEMVRDGHYLLVVDNIESTDAHNEIIRYLTEFLGGSTGATQSRALVTSRKPTTGDNIQNQHDYSLGGIHPDGVDSLATSIQRGFSTPLSLDRCHELAEHAHYNPLFLQIALNRYRFEPTEAEFKRIIDDLQHGHSLAFQQLFSPLEQRLTKHGARSLALYIAQEPSSLKRDKLRRVWKRIYAQLFSDRAALDPIQATTAFNAALRELIYNRIVSVASPQDEEYTMHPLIRAYFRQRSRQSG